MKKNIEIAERLHTIADMGGLAPDDATCVRTGAEIIERFAKRHSINRPNPLLPTDFKN